MSVVDMMEGDAICRHVLTILAVEDVDRSQRFYREVFDWPVSVEVPVYVEFELPGGQRIGIYERNSFGTNTGEVPSKIEAGKLAPTELYFYSDDASRTVEKLERAGARRLSAWARRPWGDDAAYYADPDGNVVVIASPGPREQDSRK